MKPDHSRRSEALAELSDAAESLLEASRAFAASGGAALSERASALALLVLALKRDAVEHVGKAS